MRHASLPLFLAFALSSLSATGADVDYLTEIKPLLRQKCYSCHGVLKQESDLRLETRSLMMESDVVSPGDPASSELLIRIKARGDERMPPAEDGAALLPDQVQLIERWIGQGAKAPEEKPPAAPAQHWAFQPIPDTETLIRGTALTDDGTINPVDFFLESKRVEKGLDVSKPAARPLLIRRLYLDLVGLPPTPSQLRDDRPWDQIVDELLAEPAYAERWARHWMDVWRYSDWYGLGKQIRYSQKHIWHWRDWIIRSLADDKGYDQMILEMIAGDEWSPTDPESVAGTGFLARNYYLFNRTTWLDNTIEHTGKAFLGLTLNCAKCHDHKYDPISQLDYYRFRAILEPHQIRLDPVPGVTDFEQDGLPRAFDDSIDRPTYLHVRGDSKNPDKSQTIGPGVPAILASFEYPIQPVALPPSAFAPGTRDHVQRAASERAKSEIAAAEKELVEAKKRLAELSEYVSETKSDGYEPFEIVDEFDAPDQKRWQLVGDGWRYTEGVLHQTRSTRESQMVRLLSPLPRDFEVECDYTTTGGSTYKSVTFRFDQSDDGKQANFVYTSAHAPGPKLQVAFTRNGSSTYPAEGRKAQPISVGQKYHLHFAVRDTLVNVWLEDKLLVAYELPDRLDGFFSISGFDATVAFERIRIRSLSPDQKLFPAGNKKIASPADAKTAVKAAELKLASAIAELRSVQATIAADNARYRENRSAEDAQRLARVASELQLNAKIADAEYRIVADATDAAKLKTAKSQNSAAQKSLAALEKSEPEYESLRGSKKALESPAHKEADYPATYTPMSSGRRLALARWMTSNQNPLTARVAVNHVWMRHFGTPLVESVFDFGLRAEKPLHAELLDFLAADFMASGWSFKHLHRQIVTSEAYRLETSTRDVDPVNRSIDPENEFYWRFNARRMESQLVRDSLLALGKKLDTAMGGPSVDPGPGVMRRSVYLKHSRDQQDKFLTMFDDADILQCYRRSESIVPQQALALTNSKLAIDMSMEIAARISSSPEIETDIEFVNAAFFQLLCRKPTPEERRECQSFINEMSSLNELKSLDEDARRTRIRSRLIQAIINHNDFVTIR